VKRYLGVDYGAARIGLATGDDESKLARRHKTVAPHELAAAVAADGPYEAIVVGLPRGLDGQDTAQTLAVRRFSDDVLGKLAAEIVFQDEAGTSALAEERLDEAGGKYERADIDAEAAAIILQDYLDTL
jgi:putative Holliday junction resolvase